MARKMVVANWKENPRTEAQALKLFAAIHAAMGGPQKHGTDVVLCPPFIYLEDIAHAFRKVKKSTPAGCFALGAQDAFWEERGAFTSEVGPKMLRSLGMEYVILGHSERRKYAHDTDAIINKKVKLALKDGLKVILCVGEAPAVRERGAAAARRFVKAQLKKDLAGVSKASVIVAYEPLWAIGTGHFDEPADAAEMLAFIKDFLIETCGLKAKVLYGGSVDGRNVGDYIQYKSIDGALVGGASLNTKEFIKIITT